MKFCRKPYLLVILLLVSFPLFSQMYLELNLSDPAISANPFARPKQPLELFRVIERAADDNRVQGIILNIGSISRSRDFLWELRGALEQFKTSGKKICAYIGNADMDIYILASVADKIVMDELGVLTMLGYSAGGLYVSQTLEKLGIGVRELRYFEYKSAMESFTRTAMSDADRRQNEIYLDDIYNISRNTLMDAKGWSAEKFDAIINYDFMHSATSALTRGLVDYAGAKNAVQAAINEMEEKEITDFFLYGNDTTSLTGSKLKYSAPEAGGSIFRRPPVIAVVYAEGQTDMETGMNAVKLSKIVRDLADNGRVKAVVVKINSPGGSAVAADYLAEAIRYAQQKKPVVVSMGQVAASGGYWAAITANHVMATPYTVTGSIGVIGSWFYDNGLYNKLGVSVDVIKRGAHSDFMTGVLFPYRNLTAHEEEQYKKYILDIYNVFINKVAAGRKMEKQTVEAVAQGRIFSGTRALEAGLIDSIGSLADALSLARTLAEIPEATAVDYREYPEPTFTEKLLNNFPVAAKLFGKTPAETLIDLILPNQSPDIRYRLERNGQVMPILPLEFSAW